MKLFWQVCFIAITLVSAISINGCANTQTEAGRNVAQVDEVTNQPNLYEHNSDEWRSYFDKKENREY